LTFGEHLAPIRSAAFSPSGQQVLTASELDGAMLWSVESGNLQFRLHVGQSRRLCSVFSVDGQQVLTTRDATAKIWSAISGECVRTVVLEVPSPTSIIAVQLSPDAQEIVAALVDRRATMLSAISGQHLRTLEGHRSCVHSAAFSPSGREVLTASQDGTAKIWSAAAGECLRTLQDHDDLVSSPLCSAVFSPDEQEVLTVSSPEDVSMPGTMKIWCASSGVCLCTLVGGNSASFAPIVP